MPIPDRFAAASAEGLAQVARAGAAAAAGVEALERMAKPIRALAMDAVERAVPQLRRDFDEDNRCSRGVCELTAAERGAVVVSLFVSGSEVVIALTAKKLLGERKIPARVVSVPCFELLFARRRTSGPRSSARLASRSSPASARAGTRSSVRPASSWACTRSALTRPIHGRSGGEGRVDAFGLGPALCGKPIPLNRLEIQ
jgi:hypothetical protein